MKKMTEENIKSAFSGESQAHMRYLIFAKKAEEEGFANVARLFKSIAFAEQVHATNHLKVLGEINSSAQNLQAAIDGETFEVAEIYPAYKEVAKLQEEKGAVRSTDWALQAEKIHAAMYQKTKQAVEDSKDIELKEVFICELCGYTVEGGVPDRCPICGAPKQKFRKF
ncbi:MAG: rubrerythrin family protein [Candidatus Zixiibacteriota bacterium]